MGEVIRMPELNGRQRLELALLCDDYEQAGRSRDPHRFAAANAALVRYVVAEGLTPAHFRSRGESIDLNPGYTAALMATYPDDFEPGSLGHKALTLAGFFPDRKGAA